MGIHHVAVAVHDLDEAIETYGRLFGAEVEHRDTVDEQGVEAAAVLVGSSRIELLAATGADTPVGRFLARRGPGMHHVAYEVDDLEQQLARLDAEGVELIDRSPRRGLYGMRSRSLDPYGSGRRAGGAGERWRLAATASASTSASRAAPPLLCLRLRAREPTPLEERPSPGQRRRRARGRRRAPPGRHHAGALRPAPCPRQPRRLQRCDLSPASAPESARPASPMRDGFSRTVTEGTSRPPRGRGNGRRGPGWSGTGTFGTCLSRSGIVGLPEVRQDDAVQRAHARGCARARGEAARRHGADRGRAARAACGRSSARRS